MPNKLITPRKLAGFNELMPTRQLQFDEIIQSFKRVFQRHCFLPLDTPVLELSEILLAKSGGDIDKEIYRFTKGSTDMCMRYDFTVPLARFVAMNFNDLNFPFKRYQIGKVYRGERPQKGRFREFYQCDADIIGDNSLPLPADAECISLYKDCFKEIGFECVVEISNRLLLNGLIEEQNLSCVNEILTLLDKIDKIGESAVKESLLDLELDVYLIEKLLTLVKTKGTLKEVLGNIKNLSTSETYIKGISQLKELDSYLKSMGLDENDYIFNLSIIRGHNYYTGTVFETFLKGHREFGAVGGGGRFENLAGYYTEKNLPGVGMSIGLSRLFDVLCANDLLPAPKNSNTDVNIIPLGQTLNHCLWLCSMLQKQNIKSSVAYEDRSFKNKLKEADKQQVPFVIIVGEDEIKEGKYSLKDMTKKEQLTLSLDELVLKIKNHKTWLLTTT